MKRNARQEAINRSAAWWLCENIVNHEGQVGLLRMDFPRVFILVRDQEALYYAIFDEFKSSVADVHFFNPEDRENTDLDSILVDAWNFLALVEWKEDMLYEQNNGYKTE